MGAKGCDGDDMAAIVLLRHYSGLLEMKGKQNNLT